MNDRQRFHATMNYQPRDRSPIMDFGFWDETLPIWHEQGLPTHVNRLTSDDFFGMDAGIEAGQRVVGAVSGLAPTFEELVLEDRGEYELRQQADGVQVLRRKFLSSIPLPVSHKLTDRESWREHFAPKLDPTNPARYPANWDERVKVWRDPNRESLAVLPGGSLYGWLRNWMGVENLSLVVYDDPAWFEEMIETEANCIIGTLTRILETGGHFDACGMWEDMAYNAGPLLSPQHFKKYMVPHYRRITDLLHSYGVNLIWVDCDGKIDLLVPHWLDAGVNCMFPLEVGTWGADPIKFRAQYGKDLLLMGGFDKHILAQTKEDIKREVYRLLPLVEEGGYVGFCDHRVPPDVSLDNYLFYLDTVREVWGLGVNLKPVGKLEK